MSSNAIVNMQYPAMSSGILMSSYVFSRADMKKQGRELGTKARLIEGWISKNGLRRPKKPKKHTPSRDHRKYILLLLLGKKVYDLLEEYFEE